MTQEEATIQAAIAETRAATVKAAAEVCDAIAAASRVLEAGNDPDAGLPMTETAEKCAGEIRHLLDPDRMPGPVLQELSRRVRMAAAAMRASGGVELADDIDALLNSYASLNGVQRWEGKK